MKITGSGRVPATETEPLLFVREEIEKAVKKICQGRTILGIFSGRIYRQDRSGGFRQASGFRLRDYLILTTEHLIFWGRGESGQKTEFVPYTDISAVEIATGTVFGELTIEVQGGRIKFGDIPTKEIPWIHSFISGKLAYYRNLISPSPSPRTRDIHNPSALFGPKIGIALLAASPGNGIPS